MSSPFKITPEDLVAPLLWVLGNEASGFSMFSGV
jgi:hypothetical protein